MSEKKRWIVVTLFAIAMAWMESATVVYLRTLVGRIDPYQRNPLPISIGLGQTELIREAATLVMLFTAGWLAGRTWRSRWAYSMIAFGVWDIFYYVFLAVISGWPHSLLDWDVLFLIPLPWWGPVIAPVIISSMMIVGGTLISQFDQSHRPIWPGHWTRRSNLGGIVLALYVFMSDAIRSAGGGVDAIRTLLPTHFNWPLFVVALILMTAPIVDVGRKIWEQRVNEYTSNQRINQPS